MPSIQTSHSTLRIAGLAWPILVGQLAVIASGVLDTAMISRYSETDLAALALGASIYICIFVSGHGVLQALSPTIGQLFGAKRYEAIGAGVKQGAWLALFISIVGCVIMVFPQPLLSLAHASPELTEKATLYLRILALALPAIIGFRVYSALNNAVARPKIVMAIHVVALLAKVPLNTLFIFGGLGIPALGGPGAAFATALIAWLCLLAAFVLLKTSPFYRVFAIFGTGFVTPQWAAQRMLLRLGLPIGLSYLIEVSAFAFMAIFITRLGETMVAGHQITSNFGTVLYMLPLAIASATGTLVAQAIGARKFEEARQIGNQGIRLAAILCSSIGVLVFLGRDFIIRTYTPNEAIVAAALPLFLFIGFYQLFDAIQVTAGFVLRAYRIIVVPTLIYAFSLWGVGLAGGYVLGLDPFKIVPSTLQGAVGFWIGNSISIALVAIGLLIYLRKVQRTVSLDHQTQ